MANTLQDNLKQLHGHLAQFAPGPLPHRIGGQRLVSRDGATFANHTPIDNSRINTVSAGGSAEVDAAASAARDAFAAWRGMDGAARRSLLHAVADAIEARADEIALVESFDTGQPLRFMSKAAIRGAENFRFFADKAPEAGTGRSMPTRDHINYSLRQPLGPVAVITPWNTPFMLSTWKIAPALAAGCTVVHKPAEWSPLSASLLADICADAGVPPGVLNTVHGPGESTGRLLTEHVAIRAVAFVGESHTGSLIMRQGAMTLKRVHFEMGGKNPVIVFDDANLQRAVDAVVLMIYSLNGERCTSSSRLLVQAGIYDQFVERVAERAARIRVGHPLDPATEVGPLIHPNHLDKVRGYFDTARAEGATLRVGGSHDGNYVRPTLLTGARNHMRIAQEEIFGPILTAIPFEDEADAITQANDVAYGLAAYAWTGDAGRAHRLGRDLEAGMVWINSENNRHLPTPFGGMKASGIGRDGGDYSFDFYMETKNVCVALDTHGIQQLGTSD